MGITFDHVEGVVQKASEGGSPSPAPASSAGGKTPKPLGEQLEEHRRRAERMASRLHAD